MSKISTLNLINLVSKLGSMYSATATGLSTVIKGVNISKSIAKSATTARIITSAGAKLSQTMTSAGAKLNQATKLSSELSQRALILNGMFLTMGKEIITEEPDLSGLDMDYYIAEACMELVPVKFEGTMIGLRVKYTLDSQLYGLAHTIAQYIDIDPSELWDGGANFNSDMDDIMSTVLDLVESEIDSMGDQDRICKNFWNNRKLV